MVIFFQLKTFNILGTIWVNYVSFKNKLYNRFDKSNLRQNFWRFIPIF